MTPKQRQPEKKIIITIMKILKIITIPMIIMIMKIIMIRGRGMEKKWNNNI